VLAGGSFRNTDTMDALWTQSGFLGERPLFHDGSMFRAGRMCRMGAGRPAENSIKNSPSRNAFNPTKFLLRQGEAKTLKSFVSRKAPSWLMAAW
jgi:hypothetical protein